MIRFYDYFCEDYKYTLYALNYQKIESNKSGSFKLLADDNLAVEKQDDSLCCYYTRKLYFEPDNIFSVNAQYKILFSIREKMDISPLSEQEILDSLKHDALESLDQVATRMSLIIAQTLSSANQDPIILPPNFLTPDLSASD